GTTRRNGAIAPATPGIRRGFSCRGRGWGGRLSPLRRHHGGRLPAPQRRSQAPAAGTWRPADRILVALGAHVAAARWVSVRASRAALQVGGDESRHARSTDPAAAP